MAIKIQNVQNHLGSKINSGSINSQDVTQLWFIDIINNGKDYELANALSGFVFDETGQIVTLTKGNWTKTQMFKI